MSDNEFSSTNRVASDPTDMPQATESAVHPWRRFVALGDSFTEGIGDPEASVPGGHRGWADRVAEVLSRDVEGFSYANLAVRGKLIAQIIDEQLDAALELGPDLITLSAGGNDIIRPGTDPDFVAEKLDGAVRKLSTSGATLVLFTGVDVGFSPVFRGIRGKVAIYNEHIRAVPARHGAIVADLWSLAGIQDARMWAPDRLHLNSLGHHTVARMVLDTLQVPNDLEPLSPEPVPPRSWRRARADDLSWARQHLMPWVMRRIRHQSSGDTVTPKRPRPEPWLAPERPSARDEGDADEGR